MIVYKIRNLINNKQYIGITTKTLNTRWEQHCRDARLGRDNYLLHKAINKYGEDNFIIEEIDIANSVEELKQKEIYYIQYYQTYCKNYDTGYNMTPGGDLNCHLKGENSPVSKNSDEQRRQIVYYLKETNTPLKQIAELVGLNSLDGEKLVSMINTGENFYCENESYPLRKNSRSIAKTGELNPMADVDAAKKIIYLLENSTNTQDEIAKMCNVHFNTVNDINRCVRWTHLHNYRANIRDECGVKSISKKEKDMAEKVLRIIKKLEDQISTDIIAKEEHTSTNTVCDINKCRKFKYLHNYKENIRKESKMRREGGLDVNE